jgi:serine/threonine protein kinase
MERSADTPTSDSGRLTPRTRRKLARRLRPRGPAHLNVDTATDLRDGRGSAATTSSGTTLSRNSSFHSENESPLASLGMRQYSVHRNEPLGTGASATVYRGFDTMRGDHVAVKIAHVQSAAASTCASDFEAEFRTLTQLAHEHIVRVRHMELSGARSEAQIVMEWMPGGSIRAVIERSGFRLHELVIRRYLRELLLGIEYLHGNRVLHRDIKGANLLLSGTGQVKVSDFGTCRVLTGAIDRSHTTTAIVGTPAYMAPEVVTKGHFSRGADMWSVACTVVEMATGQTPWSNLKRSQREGIPLMFHIGTAQPPNHHPPLPMVLSPQLRQLLEQCFEYKAKKRPSATALLALPYFDDHGATADALVAALGMEPVDHYQQQLQMALERHSTASFHDETDAEDTDSSDSSFSRTDVNPTIDGASTLVGESSGGMQHRQPTLSPAGIGVMPSTSDPGSWSSSAPM